MKTTLKSKHRAIALGIALGLLFSIPFAPAQVIHLDKSAVVEPGQDVRLGNVATVQGADARTLAALANTVILPGVQGSHTIGADSILMAVVAQLGPGGVSNDLQMAGAASCQVTLASAPAAPQPVMFQTTPREPSPPPQENPGPSIITASVSSGPSRPPAAISTLADTITTDLGTDLHLPRDQFRVEFETENPLLDQAPPAGGNWQCRPLTRSFLGTVPFSAELIQGTRVVQRVMIQTHVEMKSKVLVATKQIAVGDVMTSDCFQVQDQWFDRSMPTLFTKNGTPDEVDVLGLEAKRDLPVGSQLDQRDFKPVEMAKQGDAITVYFISGSLKVQMNGRAQKSGRLHDEISVRNENTGQTYEAVLIGKKLAVVGGTLTEAQEKMLRETQ